MKIRYSQVARLREELVRVIPSLRALYFPGKTYFDWLSCVFPRCSKFDEQTIARRKRGIEEFMNAILENVMEIHSDSLNSLLGYNIY